MAITLSIVVVLLLALIIAYQAKHMRDRKEVEEYSIAPEELYTLMQSGKAVLLYDVRQPLDLLAHSMVIHGSIRIAPADLKRDPGLIPRDRDVIVYCTCPTDKTAHLVIRRALSMHYTRARLLRGGLDAWRDKGYATEPFITPFHLEPAIALF
jgi:rhodanese-related sulfurtransferase